MKLWLRIDADSPRDPRIGKVARQIGLPPRYAFGMVVATWCAMGEHAPDGDLAEVDDALIEEWAGWATTSKKDAGRFAAALRAAFCDEHGVDPEFAAQQGALVRRMEKDRTRKRGGGSEEVPRRRLGESNGITERNGTEPKSKVKRASASGEAIPRTAGLDALPKTDCDQLFETWSSRRGVVAYGRFRKNILLLFQAGVTRYTTDELREAIIAYADWVEEQPDKEQGFCTLERFVSEITKWVRFGKMPLVEGGELTERGQWCGTRELRDQALERRTA